MGVLGKSKLQSICGGGQTFVCSWTVILGKTKSKQPSQTDETSEEIQPHQVAESSAYQRKLRCVESF